MRESLESALGLYSPSFFKIYLGVREQIDNVFNLSPNASAAFLHEYVHFLQDITTIYGQKNIISVVDYIKTVNVNQRESGNTALPIPYVPQQNRDDGAYYNNELEKLHIGTRRMEFAGSISNIIISIKQQDLGYEIKDIELVELGIPEQDLSYKFGSLAIIESMAYGIEQAVYPGVLDTPNDFCYTAATEVIRFCYPVLLKNSLHVIALCDATLMYYNPAAVFYHALVQMKEQEFVPPTPYHIYSFVYDNFSMEFHMLDQVDPIFNNHTLTAISQLEGYFTTDLFAANRTWMRETLLNANLIRRRQWGFFLDLASGGPLNENDKFRYLYGGLGMPMVINADSFSFFASPVQDSENIRPDILWAINQIYNIYWNTPTSQIRRCGLVEYCQESCRTNQRDDYTDQRCWDNPWSRVNDAELCVFAQVWKTWGLEHVVPTSIT